MWVLLLQNSHQRADYVKVVWHCMTMGVIPIWLVNSLKHPLLFKFHVFRESKKYFVGICILWFCPSKQLRHKFSWRDFQVYSDFLFLNALEMFLLRWFDFAISHFSAASVHYVFVFLGSGGIFVTSYLPSPSHSLSLCWKKTLSVLTGNHQPEVALAPLSHREGC